MLEEHAQKERVERWRNERVGRAASGRSRAAAGVTARGHPRSFRRDTFSALVALLLISAANLVAPQSIRLAQCHYQYPRYAATLSAGGRP